MIHNRFTRLAVALAVALAVTVAGAGTALAASVVTSGVVTVQVDEGGPDGTDLYLPMPAALVDFGLGVAALAMPADEMARMRREMEPYAPTIQGLADELERMPDAVLVEVTSDRDHVTVEKRGGHFVIDVDSDDAQVHVTVPARTISRVVEFVAG